MITIDAQIGKWLALKAAGDNFYKDLDFIKKELIGRRYNADTKLWEIPILQANLKILEKAKKHFEDHDAVWVYEDDDFENFMTVNKEGDTIILTSFYDEKLVDIIRAKKTKDDTWDKEKWNLTESTWKALKNDITKYLDQQKEKYEINV